MIAERKVVALKGFEVLAGRAPEQRGGAIRGVFSQVSLMELGNVESSTILSSVGNIHFGLNKLDDEDPDVIVLPAADEDAKERPLGVGTPSHAAKMAFKRAFIPEFKKKGKPTIVGDETAIEDFKRIMAVEMLTPRDKALDTGGFPIGDLGFFFKFETLREGGVQINAGGGTVSIKRCDEQLNTPGFNTPYLVADESNGETTIAGVKFTCNLDESVRKVDQIREEMRDRMYYGTAGRPSIHVIGASNLLSEELDTCKVYDDGKGNKMLLDMGVDLETLIRFGEDPLKINTLLITHPHTDHTRGIGDLLLYKAMKALEAKKAATPGDKLKLTALVLNEQTKTTLEEQLRSVLGVEHFEMIKDTVQLRVLEKEREGALGYRPIEVNGTTIEAMDVRHTTEKCMAYKLTSECTVDGIPKKVSYACSGDMQFGTDYLDKPDFKKMFPEKGDAEFQAKKMELQERDNALVRFLTPARDVSRGVISVDSGLSVIHASPESVSIIDSRIRAALGSEREGVLTTYQDHCPSNTKQTVNGVFTSGVILDLTSGAITQTL